LVVLTVWRPVAQTGGHMVRERHPLLRHIEKLQVLARIACAIRSQNALRLLSIVVA
jgi:hypothetical protein